MISGTRRVSQLAPRQYPSIAAHQEGRNWALLLTFLSCPVMLLALSIWFMVSLLA